LTELPQNNLTIPNVLTLLRLATVPVFLVMSLRGEFTIAFVLFVSAAVTDVIDGFVARRFNQRSRLGAILDPAADKTMMVCGYLFYTLHHIVKVPIPGWLTFTILIRDVLIITFAYLLYTRVQVRRFPPSPAGKASTLLQAITLAAAIGANGFAPGLARLAEVLFRVALAVTLYSAWDYLRRAERLLDPAPLSPYNPRLDRVK
jgi:cardiolipin synthase